MIALFIVVAIALIIATPVVLLVATGGPIGPPHDPRLMHTDRASKEG